MHSKPLCPLCAQPVQSCGRASKTPEAGCWCQQDGKPFPDALLAQLSSADLGTACICQNCVQAFYVAQDGHVG